MSLKVKKLTSLGGYLEHKPAGYREIARSSNYQVVMRKAREMADNGHSVAVAKLVEYRLYRDLFYWVVLERS